MFKPLHERIIDLCADFSRKHGANPTTLYIGLADFRTLRQSREYAQHVQLRENTEVYQGMTIIEVVRENYLAVA